MTPLRDHAGAPGSPPGRPALCKALDRINAYRRESSATTDACPVTLGEPLLPAGSSNHSVLVHAGSKTLVLRLDGIDPARNGIHRDTEYRLQSAAAAAGLAPTPRFVDFAAGVLLVDYLAPDPAPMAHSLLDVATLLRGIHALRVDDAPRLSLASRVLHYETGLHRRCSRPVAQLLQTLSRRLRGACEAIDADAANGVICHNDLSQANRVCHRGRLYALDWEYAACGSRWFDLAIACEEATAAPTLLRAYLQRAANAREIALFLDSRRVARYLELLWLACNTDLPERELQDRLRNLQSHLENSARPEQRDAT